MGKTKLTRTANIIETISKYSFVVNIIDKTFDFFFIEKGFSAINLTPYISKPKPIKQMK